MKFKVGDLVRMKPEFRHGNYVGNSFVDDGQIVTVSEVKYLGFEIKEEPTQRLCWFYDAFELAGDAVTDGSKSMSQSLTGGLRDNKGKPRLSLVPASLEESVAQVIWRSSEDGGGKYPLHNWKKGLPWSEVAESAMRHLKAFAQKAEDNDTETGLDHLAHAACNVAFLLEYRKTCPELDDRPKPEPKKESK